MSLTKSISAPLDRKATTQLQSHWIRNKHQSSTKSNENTIFHDSHAKYRLLHIMRNSRKTVAKGSFYQIVKCNQQKTFQDRFYICLVRNILVISPPSRRRSSSSHLFLSLSPETCARHFICNTLTISSSLTQSRVTSICICLIVYLTW